MQSQLSAFISQVLPQFSQAQEVRRVPVNGTSPGTLLSFDWVLGDSSLRTDLMLRVAGSRTYTVWATALREELPRYQEEFDLLLDSFRVILPTQAQPLSTGSDIAATLDDVGRRIVVARQLTEPTGVTRGFQTRENFLITAEQEILGEESLTELQKLKDFCLVLNLCVPSDDLKDIQIELLALGVLGYYRAGDRSLTIVTSEEKPDPLSYLTYAHEFVHALQDEHYGLVSLEPEEPNFDASIALLALEEGDAELSKNLFYESLPLEEQALMAGLLSKAVEEFTGAPVIDRLPPIMRETYGWEYTSGTDFVFRLYLEGGMEAVHAASLDPPASSEHIMHPEKYLSGELPHLVELPDLASGLGESWRVSDEGVMGELLVTIYLATFVGARNALVAGEGWGGDRFTLLKDDADRSLMAIRSSWDTEADALEFFQTYIALVEGGAHGLLEATQTEEGRRVWSGDDRTINLSLAGDVTLVVMGPDSATVEAAVAAVDAAAAGG